MADLLSDNISTDVATASELDIPHELQRPIFEMATRMDRGTGFSLVLVAHYVHTWIQPILYENIELLSATAASSFLKHVRSKPRGFFDGRIKTLSFSSAIYIHQAKPILQECSRTITAFSACNRAMNPTRYLNHILSPYMQQLSLVSGPSARHHGYDDRPFNIPTDILFSLTHLVVVSGMRWLPWEDLSIALSVRSSGPPYPTGLASLDAFQNLTHFAVSYNYWEKTALIRNIASNLRFFVILENFDAVQHASLIKSVREMGDRRFIVMDLGHFEGEAKADSRNIPRFWMRVEELVEMQYLSDCKDRWTNSLDIE
ncbi:uncharacterized protein LACBIDRAFT_293164 [Laccaria bicolor S238N-H82]|uniref:Predicted protein n=1 Tax=Laccaria bicolor (strain S238N-H82 / ATCC MYA-4686) TaxID=486041 RepID=B0D155_LACBS|nr:uncharacterized protein LACBIDRAFT_293164 [Laccaria bicolor S238N-H82]EDR11941.1 predicted protein [Laccaria bicolor S238N-H82]|eukprot:XP_001877838.1 predicted protein [Laccaria bicolor S238N-H82]